VDLKAVKAASAPALLACVAAAAENGDGLLGDAERLAGAGQMRVHILSRRWRSRSSARPLAC
jgi:hypothetical protein